MQYTPEFLQRFFGESKQLTTWNAAGKREVPAVISYAGTTDIFAIGPFRCHHQDDDNKRQTLNPNLNCGLCALFGFYISEAYPNVRFAVLPKNKIVITGSELVKKLKTHPISWKIWKRSGILEDTILQHLNTHYKIDNSQTPQSLSEAWIGHRIARPLYGLEKTLIRYIACPNPTCTRSIVADATNGRGEKMDNITAIVRYQLKIHAKHPKHTACRDVAMALRESLPAVATHKDLGAFWAVTVFNVSPDHNMRMHFEDGYAPKGLQEDQLSEPTQTTDEDEAPDSFLRPYWYPRAMYDFGVSIGAVRTSPEPHNTSSTSSTSSAYYVASLLASPSLLRSRLKPEAGKMFLMQRLASVIDYLAYLHLKAASAILVSGPKKAKDLVTAR